MNLLNLQAIIKKREEKAVWKFYGAETDDESDEDDMTSGRFSSERQDK
jgi:hypothetical protein